MVWRGNLITGAGLLAAAVLGAWLGTGGGLHLSSYKAQILAATVVAVMLVMIGAHRSIRHVGRIDPFHPLVFPLAYVGLSFLGPLWLTLVGNNPIGALARATPLSPNVAVLMGLGVVAFAAGAWVVVRRPRRETPPVDAAVGVRLLHLGRAFICVPILIAIYRLTVGGAGSRGLDQLIYSARDVLSSLLGVSALAAVLLILAGQQIRDPQRLLTLVDWFLIVSLAVAIGATGTRGDAVAMMLPVLVAHVWRGGRLRGVAVGFAIVAVFMVGVLNFRNDAQGNVNDKTPVEALLGDMAVASFSTGATAARVPEVVDYSRGSTLVAAGVRQLPSPIAVSLFGPPDDTAAREFRKLIGFNNPDAGVGYSIPAEGYLNFGPAGLAALCGLVGLLGAWAYPRASFTNGRASGLFYPLLVAALPFGLRSDVLGFTKNMLYPMIFISVAFILARTGQDSRRHGRRAAAAAVRSG